MQDTRDKSTPDRIQICNDTEAITCGAVLSAVSQVSGHQDEWAQTTATLQRTVLGFYCIDSQTRERDLWNAFQILLWEERKSLNISAVHALSTILFKVLNYPRFYLFQGCQFHKRKIPNSSHSFLKHLEQLTSGFLFPLRQRRQHFMSHTTWPASLFSDWREAASQYLHSFEQCPRFLASSTMLHFNWRETCVVKTEVVRSNSQPRKGK